MSVRKLAAHASLVASLVLSVVSIAAPADARTQRGAVHIDPDASVVLTTTNLTYRLTQMPKLVYTTTRPRGRRVIHVDDSIRYQQFDGVGAAMTDSSAWLIYTQLAPETQTVLMSNLFGRAGIHLNFVRIPMAASDFSATGVPYSYDDMPPGQADPSLQNFSIAHDYAYVVPVLQQMMRLNPTISVFANPWSPPTWMKTNQAFDNLYARGALLPGMFPALAQYFVRFIEAYQAAGIPVGAVSAENEPQAGAPYPSLELPPDQEGDFIANYLAPALNAAGLHPRIWGMDRGASWAQALLGGPARALLAGIAWHCYGGQLVMPQLHQQFPGVAQMISECSPGIIPYNAGEFEITAMRNWATTAALWNIALDPAGGPVEPKD